MSLVVLLLILMVVMGGVAYLLLSPKKDQDSEPSQDTTGTESEGMAMGDQHNIDGPAEGEEGSDGLDAPEGEDSPGPSMSMTSQVTQALVAPLEVPEWARGLHKGSDDSSKTTKGGLLEWFRGFGAWTKFLVRGKELGFKVSELTLLYKTAKIVGLPDPYTILWSPKAMNRCIQGVLWNHIKAGTLAKVEIEDFMYRLLRYRQSLEMERPRFRNGIVSTRSISQGQIIRIILPQVGMYTSRVIGVNRHHMDIELPKGKLLPSGQVWKNAKVEVYFWRKDDAGYFFDTVVQNAPDRSAKPMLQIIHSDSLIRTQKRAFLRIEAIQDATIMPLRSPADANELTNDQGGYRCKLKDISESGCGILIKGKLDPGFLVKIQTNLSGFPIALCGEIKSVNVNREKRYTLLHIEAIPPSKAMRIRILSYVLGITRLGGPEPGKLSSDGPQEEEKAQGADQSTEGQDKPVATAPGIGSLSPEHFDERPFEQRVKGLEEMEEEHL